MNDLKRRQNLESEIAILLDAVVEIEASKLSNKVCSVVSKLIDTRKHEIEQELIMLPEFVDEESLEAVNGNY